MEYVSTNVITIDIGGTSADISVIQDGELRIKNPRDTTVADLPVLAPMIDIDAIGAICREAGVLFHSDAAQTAGKLPLDVRATPVDMLSLSAHKFYGPKGMGALYVRRHPDVRLSAQIHGGGHERNMRSGTLATHQCVGMGEAFRIAKQEMAAENQRISALRDRFYSQLEDMEELYVNGSLTERVPHNLNLSFNYVEGESLIMSLTGIMAVTGRVGTGMIIDRIDRRRAGAVNFAVQAAGLAVVIVTDGPWGQGAGWMLFGLGVGNQVTLYGLIAHVEFTRADFARAMAVIVAICQFTYAFGPGLIGAAADVLGYGAAFGGSVLLLLVASVLVVAGRPKTGSQGPQS